VDFLGKPDRITQRTKIDYAFHGQCSHDKIELAGRSVGIFKQTKNGPWDGDTHGTVLVQVRDYLSSTAYRGFIG
jgi:hypothetical protein